LTVPGVPRRTFLTWVIGGLAAAAAATAGRSTFPMAHIRWSPGETPDEIKVDLVRSPAS